MVKTTDCGSVMRGFESHHPPHKTDFDFCRGLFYLCGEGENALFCGLNERAKCGAVLLCCILATKSNTRSHVDGERSDRIPPPAPFTKFAPSGAFFVRNDKSFRGSDFKIWSERARPYKLTYKQIFIRITFIY